MSSAKTNVLQAGAAAAIVAAFALSPATAGAATKNCASVKISSTYKLTNVKAKNISCKTGRAVIKSFYGGDGSKAKGWTCNSYENKTGNCKKGKKKVSFKTTS